MPHYDLSIGRFRKDHPETARIGALAMQGRIGTLRDDVMRRYDEAGDVGLTDRELISQFQAESRNEQDATITPRRIELCQLDPPLIIDSGRCKMNPKTGCPNIIWRRTTVEERIALAGTAPKLRTPLKVQLAAAKGRIHFLEEHLIGLGHALPVSN